MWMVGTPSPDSTELEGIHSNPALFKIDSPPSVQRSLSPRKSTSPGRGSPFALLIPGFPLGEDPIYDLGILALLCEIICDAIGRLPSDGAKQGVDDAIIKLLKPNTRGGIFRAEKAEAYKDCLIRCVLAPHSSGKHLKEAIQCYGVDAATTIWAVV